MNLMTEEVIQHSRGVAPFSWRVGGRYATLAV